MSSNDKTVINTGIKQFFESPVFKDIRAINEHFSNLFAPLNETKELFKWLDNLPKIAFDTWGTNISKQSVETLKDEFKRETITIQEIESLIYSMATTGTHKVAEIVCLLFVFGIVDMQNVKQTSLSLSKKTGFKAETIRLYLGRFKNGKQKHNRVQISMNDNLNKAKQFAETHKAEHLLKESTIPKKK